MSRLSFKMRDLLARGYVEHDDQRDRDDTQRDKEFLFLAAIADISLHPAFRNGHIVFRFSAA